MFSIFWLAFIEKSSFVPTALPQHIKLQSGLYKHHGKVPIYMFYQEITKCCLQETGLNVNIDNFYCCTVHSEIYIVYSPTNALFIKLGEV
jgi:hypothetical protein